MSLFSRICQSKLKQSTNQFRRHYLQISNASLLSSSNSKQYVTENPFRDICRRPTDFGNNVRCFAAPVQAKQKNEEKDTGGPRLNDQIKAEFVRLVSDEGHSILSRREALERARKLNHDLVEVQRTANPPVCKIMDFHREKYKQQIKEKDRAKSKSEVTLRKGDYKEVRFSGKTEEKDLKMKADMVKRLMDRGYRVKCAARGTEGQDLGGLLSRLSALIEDVSVVESGPRVEKGQAYIIVRHVRFGPSKKGGGKKSKAVENTGPEALNATTGTQPEDEETDPAESSLETKYHEEVENHNDFDEVFDSGRHVVSPSQQQSSISSENRYKKSEHLSRFQATTGMNNKGQSNRESPRPDSQIRDRELRQPTTNANFSPLKREINLPPKDMPKQEPFRPSTPNTPRPNFGIFSASEKKGAAATLHRSDRGSTDSLINPSTKEAKFEGNPIKNEQRGWGVFSRESSNGTTNRMSKPN